MREGKILRGRGRFWEDRLYIFKRGYILEGGVDSGRVAYICLKEGIF